MPNTLSANRALTPGFLAITPAANETLNKSDIFSALKRHLSCDWGEVSDCDWRSNDEAYKSDGRILSCYKDETGLKFWIITEADRSATTVMLPSDY